MGGEGKIYDKGVQMDNFRSLLGIRKIEYRMRELEICVV